jgi:hypothetical protein
MTELSKKQLTAVITIAALLSGAAGVIFTPEKTFACEERNIVWHCERLSATGKTCYYMNAEQEVAMKRCLGGWKPVGLFMNETETPEDIIGVYANGCAFDCRVIDGNVNSYTKCWCEKKGEEAYLGELV